MALLVALLLPMAALAEDSVGPAGATLPPPNGTTAPPTDGETTAPPTTAPPTTAPPTEEPSPTIPAEGSLILVVKLLDEDADPATQEDQAPAAGWEFDFAVGEGASIGASGNVTDDDGVAFFEVFVDAEASEASITEVLQANFNLIDVECVAIVEGKGGNEEFFEVEIIQDGTTITFEVFDGELIECFFVNAAEEVLPASPTPATAVPAGPTLPASSAETPGPDGTANLAPVLLLLGLGASATLLLVPAPRRLRR
jgi:hypothetical protein